MDKCLQLNSCYGTLKSDLTEDLNSIDAKLIRPAMDSKDSMSMLKKTIKNRENCKLDYERHKSRVDHAGKKEVRSMKDEAALARHEQDMANAKDVRELGYYFPRQMLIGLRSTVQLTSRYEEVSRRSWRPFRNCFRIFSPFKL